VPIEGNYAAMERKSKGADMRDTEAKFHEAMINIYRRAKSEAKYTAKVFLPMVIDNGGLATAKTLINSPKPSVGYTALYMRQRLDLTVEAMVVEDTQWHSLFTSQELERARNRLRAYGYEPKSLRPPQ
jgi:hypothetical protein